MHSPLCSRRLASVNPRQRRDLRRRAGGSGSALGARPGPCAARLSADYADHGFDPEAAGHIVGDRARGTAPGPTDRRQTATTGPVEYLVVGFPDGNVSDDIAPELGKLVGNKTIRILDVVFLTKDTDGNVTVAEVDELDQLAGFVEIDAEVGGLIGPEDIGFVGEELDPGSAAAVLLVEDLWAAPLASALDRSGGFLIEGARIPQDLVDAALADLPAA